MCKIVHTHTHRVSFVALCSLLEAVLSIGNWLINYGISTWWEKNEKVLSTFIQKDRFPSYIKRRKARQRTMYTEHYLCKERRIHEKLIKPATIGRGYGWRKSRKTHDRSKNSQGIFLVLSPVHTLSWRRNWQPPPVFLPGEFHGQESLAGYSPGAHKESDTTERLNNTTTHVT